MRYALAVVGVAVVAFLLSLGRARRETVAEAPGSLAGKKEVMVATVPGPNRVEAVMVRRQAATRVAPESPKENPPDVIDESFLAALPEHKGPWPRSTAELADKRKLHTLDAQDQELANYKLGILAEMRDCIGDRVKSSGRVVVNLLFTVKDRLATAEKHEIRASGLAEEDDPVFDECLKLAHRGTVPIVAPELRGDRLYNGTSINVPVANDNAYAYLTLTN